ncbi:MAG TPA: S8 family serine peptidase, partial [Solirubrobacteraceae bacterium]|nr:S8 family serine peptidase [Solirubrobacteraceae bacterium]
RARPFAAALRSRGLLAYAEENRISRTLQAPVDPLSVVPQAGWREHVVAGAVAPPVDPASPLIALVDSELDAQHPEIAGSNTTTTGGRILADYHGTATATVAAAPQNGIGIVGIWPNARTLNLPLPADISCADSARQIAAAVAAGAAVINMSYGSSTACRTEYEAIQRAIARGIVAVAAAGNEFGQGNPAEFPASLPHVLTVAATGADNGATFFSNQNAAVDLSAPGEDVLAGVPVTFDPDGHPDGFATVSGTSFSSPMVAAAVAWVRAARPDLTSDQAAQVVRLGAQDVGKAGWEASTGFGVLNLPGALAHEAPTADPLEPNDDVEFVNGRVLGRRAPAIFSGTTATVIALLDRYEDPVDVYRIRIPARARVQVRVVPAFGDPDLYVFTRAAHTVTGSRGLVAKSLRRGPRIDGVQLLNPLRRAVTRFVAVGIEDGVEALDAGYTLRFRRR